MKMYFFVFIFAQSCMYGMSLKSVLNAQNAEFKNVQQTTWTQGFYYLLLVQEAGMDYLCRKKYL